MFVVGLCGLLVCFIFYKVLGTIDPMDIYYFKSIYLAIITMASFEIRFMLFQVVNFSAINVSLELILLKDGSKDCKSWQ